MASAMRRNEKNLPPTQVGSETDMRIGHERPATRGRWNQGHLALLKSAGLPADFIFGPMGIGRFRTEAALKILPTPKPASAARKKALSYIIRLCQPFMLALWMGG